MTSRKRICASAVYERSGLVGRVSGAYARRLLVTAAAVAAVCTPMFGAVPSASAASYVPITGAGSTWSANAIDDWTTNVAQYGMVVNYSPVGSTSGRTDFGEGTVDWGASEIPYGVQDGNFNDPPPARGYAYMPDTAGGTTFMYNLKIGNTRVTNLRLSGQAVAGIFTGAITNWDNSLIQQDNPGLTMPNLPIIPVVRSDGSGATAEFTQWMLAMEPSYWTTYCAKIGLNPCTQTSAYTVLPNSNMVGQSGDLGVSGYVSQQQANGAIGYVEYSYALETGFPVALVLNAAGYYTQPTAENVAVSLLKAQINMDKSSDLYLTQDLSQVYTDTDPRTYELSSYSYMILPTDLTSPMSDSKGYTLGAFGAYLLCQGQVPLDALGYSALPINLVEAGFQQLQRIPGNAVPAQSSAQIQSCHNPTFSTNGTNTLADDDPNPPACDKQGPTQCTTATGGATTSTPVKSSAQGSQSSAAGSSSTSAGAQSSPSSAAANSGSTSEGCNPDTGTCTSGSGGSGGNGGTINAEAVSSSASLGDGMQVTLMATAAGLLLCLVVLPPVIAQASRRRRQRRGPHLPGGPGVLQ
jgi:ABC-type phosphate transport system substrate-binding protein